MPTVNLKCSGCKNRVSTYLSVLADVFGKYSKVLIHEGEVRGYELLVDGSGELVEDHPIYYCIKCWETS